MYPDIPREITITTGGGTAVRFPAIPPKMLISISYLFFGVYGVDQIVSYVGGEDGAAKRIPVILQRVFSLWFIRSFYALWIAGLWVAVNLFVSLVRFLAEVYLK